MSGPIEPPEGYPSAQDGADERDRQQAGGGAAEGVEPGTWYANPDFDGRGGYSPVPPGAAFLPGAGSTASAGVGYSPGFVYRSEEPFAGAPDSAPQGGGSQLPGAGVANSASGSFAWADEDMEHGPELSRVRPPYAQFKTWEVRYPADVVVHGSRLTKAVALTFDNGPDPVLTPRILQLLARYQVPATFCCIGNRVRRYPELVRRIAEGGHAVVSHSMSHPDFCRISKAAAEVQLRETAVLIEQTTGRRPTLFRPPYGSVNDEVIATVREAGAKVLLWDVDSLDWTHAGGLQLAGNLLTHTRPGSVIAMHGADPRQLSPDHLQVIRYVVTTLQQYRFTFKTVPELISWSP